MSVSDMLVIAGWIGLWFLWPKPGGGREDIPPPPGPRVSVAGPGGMTGSSLFARPDLIARPSPIAEALPLVQHVFPEPGKAPRGGEPRLLDRARREATVPAAPKIRRPIGEEVDLYRLRASQEDDLFSTPPKEKRRAVTMSHTLEHAGFSLHKEGLEAVPRTETPWQAVFRVSLDAEGRVTTVLAEETTGIDAVDRGLLMAVTWGHAEALSNGFVSGHVSISFGLP